MVGCARGTDRSCTVPREWPWTGCGSQDVGRARGRMSCSWQDVVLVDSSQGRLSSGNCPFSHLGVLGNREVDTGVETYGSVVSAPGNRYLLASAIAAPHSADFLVLFDLDNAFLNAEVSELVYCLLPESWRERGESGIRRLLRALYGLRRSPRAWNKKYATKLRASGRMSCSWTVPSSRILIQTRRARC